MGHAAEPAGLGVGERVGKAGRIGDAEQAGDPPHLGDRCRALDGREAAAMASGSAIRSGSRCLRPADNASPLGCAQMNHSSNSVDSTEPARICGAGMTLASRAASKSARATALLRPVSSASSSGLRSSPGPARPVPRCVTQSIRRASASDAVMSRWRLAPHGGPASP